MSYTETHSGRLVEIETPPQETLEQTLKRLCIEEGDSIELEEWADSWKEQFQDTFYHKIFIVNNRLFKLVEHVQSDDSDIYHMNKNEDGSFTLLTSFYNGGTCLSEIVEELLEKVI